MLPELREVSDVWGMDKDGKRRFDPAESPESMPKQRFELGLKPRGRLRDARRRRREETNEIAAPSLGAHQTKMRWRECIASARSILITPVVAVRVLIQPETFNARV